MAEGNEENNVSWLLKRLEQSSPRASLTGEHTHPWTGTGMWPQVTRAPRDEVVRLPRASWLHPELNPDSLPGQEKSSRDGVQSRGDAQNKTAALPYPENQLPSSNQSWPINCSSPIRAGRKAALPTTRKMLREVSYIQRPWKTNVRLRILQITAKSLWAEGLKRLAPLSGGDLVEWLKALGPSQRNHLECRLERAYYAPG